MASKFSTGLEQKGEPQEQTAEALGKKKRAILSVHSGHGKGEEGILNDGAIREKRKGEKNFSLGAKRGGTPLMQHSCPRGNESGKQVVRRQVKLDGSHLTGKRFKQGHQDLKRRGKRHVKPWLSCHNEGGKKVLNNRRERSQT